MLPRSETTDVSMDGGAHAAVGMASRSLRAMSMSVMGAHGEPAGAAGTGLDPHPHRSRLRNRR